MILTLNILLAVIVTVGIVGLLAYNVYPLRRPLRLDAVAPQASPRPTVTRSPYARRGAAHAHSARRGAEHGARSLDTAHA